MFCTGKEDFGQIAYPDGDVDSDLEDTASTSDSSEDDTSAALQRLSGRSPRHIQVLGPKSTCNEDEFEKEMQEELAVTVKQMGQIQQSVMKSFEDQNGATNPDFYDNDYFDSDSDEEGTSAEKKTKKHPVLSNDDLLYDPDMDSQDQNWVDAQRQKYQPAAPPGAPRAPPGNTKNTPSGKNDQSKPKKLPNSDAVLNCPACMTLLCLDCQRHDQFKSQYRAMFVMNCNVNRTEMLHYPERRKTKKPRHTKDGDEASPSCSMSESTANSKDQFHPVHCRTCRTEVGVMDKDDIFHFFNVLASYT